MRVSHFWLRLPGQPGTSRRSGAPWMWGIGWPFMRKTISVSSSIAFARRMPRLIAARSVAPDRCGSAPNCPVKMAEGFTPAACSTSRSRTPVHSALLIAPLPHWLPRVCGAKRARPLPPHSICSWRVTTGKRLSSSPTVRVSGVFTSPSMVRRQARGSAVPTSGTWPLLRMKWLA
jgi:hypothetical protein